MKTGSLPVVLFKSRCTTGRLALRVAFIEALPYRSIVVEMWARVASASAARPRALRFRPAKHDRCGGTYGTRSFQVPTEDPSVPNSRHESSRRARVGQSPDWERAIVPRTRDIALAISSIRQ